MSKKFKHELFDKIPVIGIMRNFPVEHTTKTVTKFHETGLTTLEVTLNSKDATQTIKQLVNDFGDTLNIGAGTVCSLNDLDAAIGAGSQFIVTPIINEEVIKKCVSLNIPIFPGAYTPSEIYKAWSLGATMIKLFPASSAGPSYFKDVLAPLNNVKLIATGGITLENFTQYLKAGAIGVGIGSNLFPKTIIDNGSWDELEKFYKKFVTDYNQYKQTTK